ncbi:hypothetical protein B0H17DRAFT_934671 [Mycena rosella]|uniref:Peptidase A2 domain-containing protein n=1 Tax=Mycena rosella TaxID=1033263 RepID=A0AAD7DKP8_MYCRO|nr:hypothetical protein B0H17DRAFT_934671 [Mycena rosella]
MRQGAPDPGGDPSEPSNDEGDRRPGNRPRRSKARDRANFPREGGRDGRNGGEPADGDDNPSGVNNLEGGNGPYNPNPPYGTAVPTIDPKLKIGSLPEWDGNPETAIDYFWEVGQMAALEGWMPEALGFWLPSRLKKGSSVQMWFSTLASTKQSEMRRHYLNYLQTMKEKFLGRKWQDLMNLKFERMAFRQDGHEKESPQIFGNRMIQAIRMLANSDDGGPKEVFLIMRKAPIRWSTILVIENIHSSEELYDKVNEHDEALIEASRTDSANAITAHNLAASLRRLGVNMDPSKSYNPTRRVNLASTEATEQIEEEIEVTELSSGEDSDEPAIRSVMDNLEPAVTPPSDKSTSSAQRPKKTSLKVHMEEIEDEYWANDARMPKAKKYTLESAEDWIDEEEPEGQHEKEAISVDVELSELPPPPSRETEWIHIQKKWKAKPGDSALGVSVLSVRGWIESLENEPVDLRLDSGADITLVSEEFHTSLKNSPRIREGHKMSLAQLTDLGTAIKGYAILKVLMETTSGEIAELEAEAYVVKGMLVPVLLGENFQLTYQMGVERNVENGTKILFDNGEVEILATGVEAPLDKEALYTLAANLTVHADRTMRAKEHCRWKAQRRRKKLLARAWMDYKIQPHHCVMVRLSGDFSEDCEWLLERGLLADAQDLFLSVPNTLISARRPFLAVSNTSVGRG